MASDSLLSPSSAPAASPAPTEHVDVAEEHTETAAATVVVDPPLMKLAVELRLQTLGYVLVNEEGAALIVKIGSHASGKPRMVHLKKNFDQVHLPPLADTLDMCAVSKALVGEVRDVFFGQNIFDLTGGMRWLRGITRTSYPLSAMPGSTSSCGHSPRLRSRKLLLSLTSFEHIVGSRR
jgi:hypothetical protein